MAHAHRTETPPKEIQAAEGAGSLNFKRGQDFPKSPV